MDSGAGGEGMMGTNNEPNLFFLSSNPRQSIRRTEFTVKEYAEREGVTPMTVRRWISKEALVTRRTPGGGIRILGVRS